MSNTPYVIHKQSGEIVSVGECPPAALALQPVPPGCCLLEGGPAHWSTHYVVGDAITPLPARPSSAHVFDYASKQWVDPRTLADFKAAKWAEIKKAREAAEFGGFTWDGSTFDSDAMSQSRIMGAVQLANLDPGFTIAWTLADNSVRSLSASDMFAVGVALGQHVAAQHEKARTLRAQIEAATTTEQVAAVAWSPSN